MPFGSLWLPVVLSSVVVWLASAVLHMALKYHRADFRPLPGEEAIREAIRKAAPGPGLYMTPHCIDPSEMKNPEFQRKFVDGPVAIVTVMRNGAPNMGKHLAQWFGHCFLISFVAAYVARHTLTPGADEMLVTRVVGTVAFAGYGLGYVQDSIWKAIPWSNSLRGMIDAAIYALLTGLIFRMLWP